VFNKGMDVKGEVKNLFLKANLNNSGCMKVLLSFSNQNIDVKMLKKVR